MSESSIEREFARQLGIEINRLRTARRISQERLAEAIDLSTNHVQLLESGLSDRKKQTPASPRLSTLVKLSAALEIPLPELIDRVTSAVGHAPGVSDTDHGQ